MSDVAILHDQFYTLGGAERVAFAMARELDAPIYAMKVDGELIPDDVDVHDISTRMGRFVMGRHYYLEDLYQMLAWQHDPELYEYDTIIQTKTNPHWFVPHADSQRVIRYLHSTPRNFYDQFRRRGGHWFTNALMTIQRMLYQHTVPYADTWVVNSDVVGRRLEMYWDVEPDRVIYPPVDVSAADPDLVETGEFLFSIGRIAHNKRIGLLRDVADVVDVPVYVAGTGPEEDVLLEDQPANLHYLGYVSEAEKWQLLSEAAATLFLAESEDFGIMPIESMASGTPVIGVEEGFTQYQIRDGDNGWLARPHLQSVVAAVEYHCEHGVRWSEDEIAAYAQQFSEERFREEIRDVVEQTAAETSIETGIELPVERAALADGGG